MSYYEDQVNYIDSIYNNKEKTLQEREAQLLSIAQVYKEASIKAQQVFDEGIVIDMQEASQALKAKEDNLKLEDDAVNCAQSCWADYAIPEGEYD